MQHTSSMPEKWRPIPGWEKSHEVSNRGRVRSITRKIVNSLGHVTTRQGRDLKLKEDAGYLRVQLNFQGVAKMFFVHRLVLLAFVGPVPEGKQVRHLDGDAKNNHLENLTYGTISENQLDRVRHGTHQETRKTECPRGHALAEPNLRADQVKRGKRSCLACARASAYVSYRQDLKHHKWKIADSYYESIMR